MPKSPIATREEVLAFYTRILRGLAKDIALRKGEGGEEAARIPPKLDQRMKAAEVLLKHGAFAEASDTTTHQEIEALAAACLT